MLIRIDPSLDAPLFEQLAASVRSQALDGQVRAGERLPSARELAASLDINVHTVLHAYQLLRDEGLVELRPGRGAILTARVDALSGLEEHIRSLVAEARKVGVTASTLTTLVEEAFR